MGRQNVKTQHMVHLTELVEYEKHGDTYFHLADRDWETIQEAPFPLMCRPRSLISLPLWVSVNSSTLLIAGNAVNFSTNSILLFVTKVLERFCSRKASITFSSEEVRNLPVALR